MGGLFFFFKLKRLSIYFQKNIIFFLDFLSSR